MLKFTLMVCASMGLLFLDSKSTATPLSKTRSSRSIWPFSSTDTTTEPPLTEENLRLIEQAGLGKDLDLSSHPLWKIHKYQGIDLKPVQIQTEILKSPELDARNVPTVTETPENTTEPVDLSFLDDLGGLAYFLPEPEDEEIEETAADSIAKVIKREEETHPGFLKKLWRKLWEVPTEYIYSMFTSDSGNEKSKEEEDLTVYLPETQGSYVAVVVPKSSIPEGRVVEVPTAPALFEPANHKIVNEPISVPEETTRKTEEAKPANTEFSRSHAWIQSWTPQASYTVHVDTPNADRKVSVSGEEEEEEEGIGSEIQANNEENEKEKEKEEILTNFELPEGLAKKLQVSQKDVDAILNDKESAERAANRLRALQREFEMRKEQLSYAYSSVRKQNRSNSN